MRQPINPLPDTTPREHVQSFAIALTVDVYESQPGTSSAEPIGKLAVTGGTFEDDASRPVQRTMTLDVAGLGNALPGMWILPTIGVAALVPELYRLPAMVITEITEPLRRLGAATVRASDPGEVLNSRPHEVDTTIAGTLRALVADACALALSRTTDVTGVPDVPVPVGTVLEFGSGRWDGCLKAADDLGIALHFTDEGDVIGIVRSDPAPAPVGFVERALVVGGNAHHDRVPTSATVLVTRGSEVSGLYGHANSIDITGEALPVWYRPVVITDRHEGDASTTQVHADKLATDLLRVRLSEVDAYERLPILPTPWLEAGRDVVTFDGIEYWVRALSIDLPSLATEITLRKVM